MLMASGVKGSPLSCLPFCCQTILNDRNQPTTYILAILRSFPPNLNEQIQFTQVEPLT